MRFLDAILGSVALAGLLPDTIATPVDSLVADAAVEVARRALPNAPNGYTPVNVSCPENRPTVRRAATLSPNETSWLEKRRNNTIQPMKDFFGHVTVANFDAAGYIDKVSNNASALPNIAVAVSGGGYRALMNGAGAIKAFDSRTENATAPGHLGGLLQSATYLAGLSGGSWLVGSIYVNNFSSISALQAETVGSVWEFGNSIFEGPDDGGLQILDSADYFKQISDAVSGKADAGFPTSITDYWGRALSYQMINATDGGPDYTWSSIALTQDFQDGNMPMPIVVSDSRNPGELLVGSNASVFEFNPWEFGSFDPTVYGFAPLEYLGTKFVDGKVPNNETCVRGFDNAGFVMGTSSTLFNQFLLQINSTSLPSFLKDIFSKILEDIGRDNEDIAEYHPNPFYGFANRSSPFASEQSLNMVDGGEDLENIPLHPLIQPERHVDVIFAVDSSADTQFSWPNGTSLVATYERSLNRTGIANGTAFPAIPDQNTFVNLGLNTRPTFFGCNSSNMTGPSPLIVYLPNYPYTDLSNVSTFDPSYDNTQRDSIILNGYQVATMANATRDSNWPSCVACAILSRSMERTNTVVPDTCNQCFSKYCWNGTVDSTTPNIFEPTALLGGASLAVPPSWMLMAALGATAVFLAA
ncbi:lysophospholipase Plb1 [Paecilomyces variotii No. 5]|uniref:Lysophospholipase n=1 Tax=Byssochlamys spectabilis (strain No. 5 / NBRC 109023) TaxID=1356009 RepID=V5G905_BYSSN|nr:lysophospholipase Plb1 [Paecilomyces variotii No. 5]